MGYIDAAIRISFRLVHVRRTGPVFVLAHFCHASVYLTRLLLEALIKIAEFHDDLPYRCVGVAWLDYQDPRLSRADRAGKAASSRWLAAPVVEVYRCTCVIFSVDRHRICRLRSAAHYGNERDGNLRCGRELHDFSPISSKLSSLNFARDPKVPMFHV